MSNKSSGCLSFLLCKKSKRNAISVDARNILHNNSVCTQTSGVLPLIRENDLSIRSSFKTAIVIKKQKPFELQSLTAEIKSNLKESDNDMIPIDNNASALLSPNSYRMIFKDTNIS